MPKVQIVISAKGDTTLEVSGAKGMTCEELTRCFEDALGTKISVEYKPEDFVVLDDINSYVHEGE